MISSMLLLESLTMHFMTACGNSDMLMNFPLKRDLLKVKGVDLQQFTQNKSSLSQH